jgi:drug/metabolite transporter (DMT)-like permease
MLFMLGVLLFACMDSMIKYLVSQYEAPLVVAVRYIVNALLMAVLLTPTHGRTLVRTQRTGLVVVRGCCLAGASLFMALALQRMPVAETTAILFLSPLLVVLIAGPLLGEEVGVLGWVAAIAGFAGILLIANPGADLDPLGTTLAFCAAMLTVGYQLLSRVLATTEGTLPMLFYTAVIGAVAFGAFLPWSWGGAAPTTLQLLMFFGTGALAGLGHFLFTAAHRQAPASVLAPMMYAQLVWAGLLGWAVFGHVPSGMSVAGMCIVAASGILVALKSHLPRKVLAEPIE